MKLPVLHVTSLPNMYKHCSSVMLLHIDMKVNDIGEDLEFMNSYLHMVREQIYGSVESFFITSLATRITSHGETFVIFKSNIERNILSGFIEALFAELDCYCDQQVALSYQYMEAMLFLDGSPVKMFRSGKLGDDVFDSSQYQKQTIVYRHNKKPRGKQLPDKKEYRIQYDKLVKAKKKEDVKEMKQMVSEAEEYCEYYI